MFSIPFYQYEIENWKEKKQRLLDVCSTIGFKDATSPSSRNQEFSGYAAQLRKSEPRAQREISDTISVLDTELQNFKEEANLDVMDVGGVWYQQYYKSQFHAPHSHGAYGYSSVTYICFNKNEHAPAVFISPFLDPKGNLMEYVPKVDEGHIIFFPSMITHYVQPNKSNELRLILSFNIKIS